jgi:uncharacterized RDD family membrane protein YckC
VAIPLDDPRPEHSRPVVSPAGIARPYAGGLAAPPPSGQVPARALRADLATTGGPPPAPLGQRTRAAAIDAGLMAIPLLVAALVGYFAIFRTACRTYPFLDGTRTDCSDAGGAAVGAWALVVVVLLATVVLYEVLPIARRGATLGMRRTGLTLVDHRGRRLSWRRSALRSFLRWTTSLEPAALGFWWAAVDDRRLTFHDLICRTVVVEDPREASPGT